MSEVGKLDRKRSYGTVYGDPNVGFVQDEKSFRHDGHRYVPPSAPEPAAPPSPVSEERRAAQSLAMKRVWAEKRDALRDALAKQRQAEGEA